MKITINDLEFEIIEVEKDSKEFKDEKIEGLLGLYNPIEQKIFIRSDLNPVRKRKVLIHELTHLFIDMYGFVGCQFTEEMLCSFIESYSTKINYIASKYVEQLSYSEN